MSIPGSRVVVVIDAGNGRSRSPLAAVRALAMSGRHVVVATAWRHSLAASSRWCSQTVNVPTEDDPAFSSAVLRIRDRLRPVEMLACSDMALQALRPDLRPLINKSTLEQRARESGLKVPLGTTCTTAHEVRDAASAIGLPVVVKPVVSDRAAMVVEQWEQLEQITADLHDAVIVQPRLAGQLTALSGVVAAGRMVAAVQQVALRTWPVTAGVSCAARTVPVDEELVDAVTRLMDGAEGLIQTQFIGEELIDANPRPYGSLPLALAAGVNLPATWCDVIEGTEVPVRRGRAGVHYRWIDADVRAVWSAVRDRRLGPRDAAAALRPRPNTAHSVWALRDPRPTLVRAGHLVRRGIER